MQGEVAAENALGHSAEFKAVTNPSCVYSCPELACTGLTEEAAQRVGKAYDVGVFPLAANGRALIMNGGNGVIKVLVGKTHREILGVHIYGPRATDPEACLAVGMEATSDEVLATIHGHPTLAKPCERPCWRRKAVPFTYLPQRSDCDRRVHCSYLRLGYSIFHAD